MTPATFIRNHSRLTVVPGVPEVRLHLAADPMVLWQESEDATGQSNAPVPFWGCVWAGGLALARHLLDHPELVTGRTVCDVGTGSGLVAVAAARAGAAAVTATDTDTLALAAVAVNAAANGVQVTPRQVRGLGGDGEGADVVLAGDVFYERCIAAAMLPVLERAHARAARVLVGDPGRAYLPLARLAAVATYQVPVSRSLEDAEVKASTVWRPAW